MKKTILMICVCSLALSYSVATHATIYKWKDAKGVTQYTATPPPAQKKTKGKIKNIEDQIRFAAGKHRPSEVRNTEIKTKEENKSPDLSAPDKKLISYCKGQRANLAKLKANYRSVWVETDGKRKDLNQKQRKDKVDSLIKTITKECEGV